MLHAAYACKVRFTHLKLRRITVLVLKKIWKEKLLHSASVIFQVIYKTQDTDTTHFSELYLDNKNNSNILIY